MPGGWQGVRGLNVAQALGSGVDGVIDQPKRMSYNPLVDNQLTRFEKIAERLVEGSLARLFSGQLHPQEIVARLARAMEDHAHDGIAPDHYTISLNPADYKLMIKAEPTLPQLLAERVLVMVQRAELQLSRDPQVELVAQPKTPRKTVRVSATITQVLTDKTAALNMARVRQQLGQMPDGSTYLIVDGRQHIPLTKPVSEFPDNISLCNGQHNADKQEHQGHVMGLVEQTFQCEECQGEFHSGKCEYEKKMYFQDSPYVGDA